MAFCQPKFCIRMAPSQGNRAAASDVPHIETPSAIPRDALNALEMAAVQMVDCTGIVTMPIINQSNSQLDSLPVAVPSNAKPSGEEIMPTSASLRDPIRSTR